MRASVAIPLTTSMSTPSTSAGFRGTCAGSCVRLSDVYDTVCMYVCMSPRGTRSRNSHGLYHKEQKAWGSKVAKHRAGSAPKDIAGQTHHAPQRKPASPGRQSSAWAGGRDRSTLGPTQRISAARSTLPAAQTTQASGLHVPTCFVHTKLHAAPRDTRPLKHPVEPMCTAVHCKMQDTGV